MLHGVQRLTVSALTRHTVRRLRSFGTMFLSVGKTDASTHRATSRQVLAHYRQCRDSIASYVGRLGKAIRSKEEEREKMRGLARATETRPIGVVKDTSWPSI